MMTINDIEQLMLLETKAAIDKNIDRDSVAVALDKQIKNAALVASQIKYLQRCRTKLPSYFAARCIIPSRSFEQSSSEECAAHKNISGELAIDLTCGLGVDSLYLSKRFVRVISVELDPTLATIAKENFRRLGANNIEVVNSSAEAFLDKFAKGAFSFNEESWNVGGESGECGESGESRERGARGARGARADLIYADPDRRGENNRKLVLLQDCSPDMISLYPQISQLANHIVIKNSPLFDVDEAFRLFPNRSTVEVVSLAGECKEVLIKLDCSNCFSDDESPTQNYGTITTTAIGLGSAVFDRTTKATPHHTDDITHCTYLIIPDVSLVKARKTMEYFAQFPDIFISNNNGYAFSKNNHTDILGRSLEVEKISLYNPKQLKAELKAAKTTGIEIYKRDFPHSNDQISKKLSVKEGGSIKIAFTTFDGKLYSVKIK